MIFLIRYDRKLGTAEWSDPYPDTDLHRAQEERLTAETEAATLGIPVEIVILQAVNKDDLKLTHAKYFGDEALRENIRTLTS
jgi:hypothetical protein